MEEGWRVTGEMNEDGWRKDGGLQERGLRMVGGKVRVDRREG